MQEVRGFYTRMREEDAPTPELLPVEYDDAMAEMAWDEDSEEADD